MGSKAQFLRRDPELSSSHGLPAKRAMVFELAACGKATKEIARELGVSPETVTWHLNELREQFHASNRTDLISQGWMHGILQARDAVVLVAALLMVLSAMPMARSMRTVSNTRRNPTTSVRISRREPTSISGGVT